MTKFYFNPCANLCAEAEWVADYLFMGGMVESRAEAMESLETVSDFCGWSECEVSETIAEIFE